MGSKDLVSKTVQNFGAEFRKQLKGVDAVVVLKELNNEGSVEEYITQGGDILDVVSVLQHVDQSDVPVVLNALTHIVKRYLSVASAEDTTHCEEACHSVLTVHAGSIHKAFAHNKVSVLRLFAVIVQVSFHIAKTVLLSFDKCLVIDKKDTHAREDYISLVSSLLNDENIFITRTLLEKGVINRVISGLMYDKYNSVITVLNTVSEKVVSNVSINKSLKMQVFNTAALNFLYGLYHWRGAADQQEVVRRTAHALLIQLGTDYKKGIVYFDETYGTSGQKVNPLVFNFLRKIETPWMDDLSSDLVIKVLHSCPDLVKPIFDSYKSSLEPRPSNNFYQLCTFLSTFISTFDIIENLNNGNLLMNIIRHKLFPTSVLELIKTGTNMKNDIQVRYACYHIYGTILIKTDKIKSLIKTKFTDKFQLLSDYMHSQLPDLPSLLKTWKTDSDNDKVDYLVKLADVVLKYCKVFPLTWIPDRSIHLLGENIVDHPILYAKALQINAILFEPSIDNKDFEKGLAFILTNQVDNFSQVFHTLLQSSHLFDGFEQELEVWYHALNNVEHSKRAVVGPAFVSALKHMSEMMNCLEVEEDTAIICRDAATQLVPDIHNHITFTPIPNMTTCLPSLLQHCQSQEDLESFISEVTVFLFHMQTSPKSFYSIIKKFLNLPKSKTSVAHYLKSWSKITSSPVPDNFNGENSLETQLSRILIDSDESSLQSFLSKFSSKKNKNKKLLHCARMALFYATQSADHQITTISIEAFNKISLMLLADEKEIIVKEAFRNPILTNDFNKEEMVLSNLLTHLLDLSQSSKTYATAYQKFVYPKLKQLVNDDTVKFDSSAVLNLVSRLGLNVVDAEAAVKLMLDKDASKFYKKKKLSFWGKLLKYLIGEALPELCEDTLFKLEQTLTKLIDAGVDTTYLEESFVKYVNYHPQCVKYFNIDNLLDKISSPLIVALISIKPDIVSILPKPKLLIDALPVVQSVLKYAPLIGDKYLSRVYKLVQKNLLEMILSDEGISEMSAYIPELGQVLDKFGSVEDIQKICEHIHSRPNLTINSNNGIFLTLLFKKARDPDGLFTKLIKVFVDLPPEERSEAQWIHDSLVSLVTENSALSFSPSSPWHDFVKVCLKDSLNNENILSLDTLTSLCKVLPAEKCHHNIFKMIISHSRFVEIMLSDNPLKSSLTAILHVFIKGGQVPLAPSHVPLFLSAYNATLSHTDQYLFEILQHYEAKDVDMHEYKPFLWGSAAATYYSVSDSIMSKTLNRQPHPSQVTTLLLELYVKRTVTEFPQDRQLIPSGMNENEPKKYDPSFLLPLFIFILAPESLIQLNKFIHSGALAISLASLSSNDPNIRKSAYMVLIRFQSHLSGIKREQTDLVQHFIDVLRNGISQLTNDNDEDASPQLSSIVSTFLARSSLIVSNPSHQLYSTLHKYFIAKPALDLTKVPEFLVLFNSEHEYNREWILTIVRDGLNSLQDWVLCDRTVIFKILFSFYSSSLCSRTTQSLICDIINKCLCIDKGRYYLINGQGLLCWLKDVPHPVSVLETLSKHQKSDPNGFLQILLLHTLLQSKSQEDSQQVIKCVLEFLEGNSFENTCVLFSHLDRVVKVVEDQFGESFVRDAKNLVEYSCEYAIPFDQMSDITKITYLLLSQKRK
uniref:Nucleolar pre-ribosomal-associated protein 1 n=1 Tax=Cacopsylla melanoneura TaxID=428564 RepID=A0A8D8ZG98_9HEMI